MDTACPVSIHVGQQPPPNSVIRVTAYFRKPEHQSDTVQRCPNHREKEQLQIQKNKGKKQNFSMESSFCTKNLHNHVIRIDDKNAVYRSDIVPNIISLSTTPIPRESVSIDYTNPAVGQSKTTILLRYMCLSSCVGGINRRPFNTVFTLETSCGQILGRSVAETRVCSCPGRDRDCEERRRNQTENAKRNLYYGNTGNNFNLDKISNNQFLKRKKVSGDNLMIRADDDVMYEMLKSYAKNIQF